MRFADSVPHALGATLAVLGAVLLVLGSTGMVLGVLKEDQAQKDLPGLAAYDSPRYQQGSDLVEAGFYLGVSGFAALGVGVFLLAAGRSQRRQDAAVASSAEPSRPAA